MKSQAPSVQVAVVTPSKAQVVALVQQTVTDSQPLDTSASQSEKVSTDRGETRKGSGW